MSGTDSVALPDRAFLDLPDGRLAYRRWGGPADPPLVFWHALGAATSGAYLAEVAPLLLARHRLQVIGLDAPGFGASSMLPREGFGTVALADRWALVLDRLGLERPILAGHSWGASVAAQLAADLGSEARGLILLDSGHLDVQDQPDAPTDASWTELLEQAAAPGRSFAPMAWSAFVAELQSELPRWSPALEEIAAGGVRRDGDLVSPIPTPEAAAAARLGMLQHRVSSAYPSLAAARTPILLVTATQPAEAAERNRVAAERFRAQLPLARVVALPGARHDLFLDAGPALAGAIADWLDDVPAPEA